MGEYAEYELQRRENYHLRHMDNNIRYNYKKTKKKEKHNMSNNATIVYASGKLYWPKIVGENALVPNYDGDAREWTFEFEPDDTTFLKEHGLLDRLKDKEDAKNPDKGRFILLRKPEFKHDGEKNEPYRIYDKDNQPWGDELIGNGTEADLKLRIVDWGRGKKSGIYAVAIRVTNHVPYASNEFAGMDGDNEPKKAPAKAKAKSAKTSPSSSAEGFDDDELPF